MGSPPSPTGPAPTEPPPCEGCSLGLGGLAAGLIFLAASGATFVAWLGAREEVRRDVQAAFDEGAQRAEARIVRRMQTYQQVLRGVAGLFASSERVDRREFRDYVAALHLEEFYPGTRALGYAPLVSQAGRAAHLSAMRAEGLPGYSIHPAGAGGASAPVIFVEPASRRTPLAMGYDMLSDPVRRAALERARDEGQAALSGKVVLITEPGEARRAGVLLYQPVYRRGTAPTTVAERRAALVGWVYAAFVVEDLMRAILGEGIGELDIELYDGEAPAVDRLMADTDTLPFAVNGAPALHQSRRHLAIAGRAWTLAIRSLPALEARPVAEKPRAVAFFGSGATLLLTLLGWLLASGRARAMRAARHMNREVIAAQQALEQSAASLGRSREQLALILENVTVGISRIRDRKHIWVSARMGQLFGYGAEEMNGLSTRMLFTSDEAWERISREAFPVLRAGGIFRSDLQMRRKDGTLFWARAQGRAIDPADQGAGSIWIFDDVTERREMQGRARSAERLASIATLARGMTHEINNPLASVISNLAFVLDEARDAGEAARGEGGRLRPGWLEEVGQALSDASADAQRVAAIVADLRAFTSSDQLGSQLRGDVKRAVEHALRVARSDLTSCARVAVEVPALPEVRCSEAELVQLIAHLLVNAGRATGSAPNQVALRAWLREPGQVALSVSDTGEGMDENTRMSAFDPFFSTRAVGRGRGLGLSVCLGIVQNAGGEISLRSEAGAGTTVTVQLPVAANGGTTGVAAPGAPTGTLPRPVEGR